jgi:hypothetical protein
LILWRFLTWLREAVKHVEAVNDIHISRIGIRETGNLTFTRGLHAGLAISMLPKHAVTSKKTWTIPFAFLSLQIAFLEKAIETVT